MSPTTAVMFGLIAHVIGDYVLQSSWMAQEKTRRWWPAVAHALAYGVPFLFITRSTLALAVIVCTHAVIDRYRLARYVVWATDHLAPVGTVPCWAECRTTGYPPDVPGWLAGGLLIICDNTMHVVINSVALWWAFA
jgi:hypothetical protein